MTAYTLNYRWPIVDPDARLDGLRVEATAELVAEAKVRGWTYTTRPSFHVIHGPKPALEVTIGVAAQREQGVAA